MYFSHCEGILTASSWGKMERTLSDMFAYPGVRMGEERKHWHTEEFGRIVGEHLSASHAISPRLFQHSI